MSSRNVTMLGADPRIGCERDYLYGSLQGRNVVHFYETEGGMRKHQALCGTGHGWDRFPYASPDITYTVCAECLRKAGPVTHVTEAANGTASL